MPRKHRGILARPRPEPAPRPKLQPDGPIETWEIDGGPDFFRISASLCGVLSLPVYFMVPPRAKLPLFVESVKALNKDETEILITGRAGHDYPERHKEIAALKGATAGDRLEVVYSTRTRRGRAYRLKGKESGEAEGIASMILRDLSLSPHGFNEFFASYLESHGLTMDPNGPYQAAEAWVKQNLEHARTWRTLVGLLKTAADAPDGKTA